METKKTRIADLFLNNPHHRSTNPQITELCCGGVRLSGFSHVSAAALCQTAHTLDKLVSVHVTGNSLLALDITARIVVVVAPTLSTGPPITTVIGPSVVTTVHPCPPHITSSSLAHVLSNPMLIDAIIRPLTFTTIKVRTGNVKGGLAECVKNGRHTRKSNGSLHTPKLNRRRRKMRNIFR